MRRGSSTKQGPEQSLKYHQPRSFTDAGVRHPQTESTIAQQAQLCLIVTDQQHAAVSFTSLSYQQAQHAASRHRIEAGDGLVGNQEDGPQHQHTRQRNTLQFTTGNRVGRTLQHRRVNRYRSEQLLEFR